MQGARQHFARAGRVLKKKKRHKTIIHSTKNKSRPYWGGKVRRGRMKRPWGGEPGKKGRELGNTSPPTEY